jgi:flagellar hook-associated protein 2
MGSSYTTDRYRLMLTGNDTGAANTIAVDDNLTTLNGNNGTVNFTSTGFQNPPPQEAQNAQVRLDGYPPGGWIERASNTVTDLIPGVTLSLLKPSATAVQVTVADDTAAMQDKITTFVNQYNDLLSNIQDLTKYDKTSGQAGVLFGNYGVEIIKSQLNAMVIGNASGFADGKDPYINLAQIGITTAPDETSPTFGQLLIDLTGALQSNSQGVATLMAGFAGVSDDTSGNISYLSSLPGITKPGTYQVTAMVAGACSPGAPSTAMPPRWMATPSPGPAATPSMAWQCRSTPRTAPIPAPCASNKG